MSVTILHFNIILKPFLGAGENYENTMSAFRRLVLIYSFKVMFMCKMSIIQLDSLLNIWCYMIVGNFNSI